MCGPDISLFYDFDKFLEDCKGFTPEQDDAIFTNEFTTSMSSYFHVEHSRNAAIQEQLGKYLQGCAMSSIDNTDAAITTVLGNACLIIETKNEVGIGGSDSFMQLVANYVKFLKKSNFCCPMPCFLVEFVGIHMNVYGAVFTGTICVDKLAGVWLAYQPNNRWRMEEIARVFKALKLALNQVQDYYGNLHTASIPHSFPRFTSYLDINTNCLTSFSYVSEIKQHVYYGQCGGNKIVIKFVERYCAEAHKVMASVGYAPKLYSCMKVSPHYIMVVMEHLKALPLHRFIQKHSECKKAILDVCERALGILHEHNFCHGDFRENNILVDEANGELSVKIVDFDWCGKVNEVKYPLFMNHDNIDWPDTAGDKLLITKEHDKYWLSKF